MGIVLGVLAIVAAGCIVTAWIIHRMLVNHKQILATLLDRHARDLTSAVSGAGDSVKGDVTHRVDALAETITELADATRAVLEHGRTRDKKDAGTTTAAKRM